MDNTDQYPMYMCLIGISDIQHIRYLSDTSDPLLFISGHFILHCENFFLAICDTCRSPWKGLKIGKWNEYTDLDLENMNHFLLHKNSNMARDYYLLLVSRMKTDIF